MHHSSPRAPFRHFSRRAPGLAERAPYGAVVAMVLGIAACDGSDNVSIDPPGSPSDGAPPTGAPGAIESDPAAPAIAGFTTLGACSTELSACDGASTERCILRCGERTNGCVSYAEYVPLATNADEAYALVWGPIDPEGRWAFYRRELSLGRRESTLYRWSLEEGDVALAELMGLPAQSADVFEALVIAEVGAQGDAVLLLGFDADVANHGYVWTREAGLARLDFVPWDMSADGRVVVGSRLGRAVVWERDAGLRRLDGAELDAPPLIVPGEPPDPLALLTSVRWIRVSESGESVLSVENSGRGFRWSEPLGSSALDSLDGFPGDASVELADMESGALVVSRERTEREPLRMWWWGDATGAVELGTLPDHESSFRRSATLLRAGGGVIIGEEAASFGDVAVFRWSAELGTERVSPLLSLGRQQFVNADGTTVVGTASIGVQTDTFRWTAESGPSIVPGGGGSSLIALDGDALIVPGAEGEPVRQRVLKFDRALESGEALPIDLIEAGLAPARDGVEPSIHLVSQNARLLAGTTLEADGATRAWVLRLRDTCDAE